ncbi:zinc finger protein 213-like [Perca fluviatilis]|uniref:zinc finger protein 213-like n=1 Tax=Perca fluviatilis TaxID=8168 RepID=UPI001964F7E7|nr:zinc finger protein 213-like [Perca fluviatilis]
MSLADSRDYMKVKQAVLDKFNISAETYRQRFRSKTVVAGETAKELQARLKDLMGKWLVPELLTNEEVCDRIVLEQFLDMLHPELQVWVRERTPASSAQAADLVETFMAARQSRRGPQQQDWRRPYQAAQREPDKTFSGKSVGGSGRVFKPSNSPGVSTIPARAPRVLVCHGCGQPGHIRPNCTVQRMSDSRICYIPGHSKHLSGTSSDVTVPVKIGGKTVQALVDTGKKYRRHLRILSLELLFGREVRGPLDILRRVGRGTPRQPTNIASYVLKMREKLDQLSSMAHKHLARAQTEAEDVV